MKIKHVKYFAMIVCAFFQIAHAEDFNVSAISNFSVNKYLGMWYEVARLPMYFERNCIAPITASYTMNPENSEQVLVKNTCYKGDGNYSSATGRAYFVSSKNVAQLKVSFLPTYLRWLPFTEGDYWVLYTDYTHYALVGSPNHEYLWILARSEKTNPLKINQLLTIAKQQGFDVTSLIFNYT